MNFESCKADPDVWFRPASKDDGTEYMQYVLLYTDDILCVMENPGKFLSEEFGQRFKLKEKTIGPPTHNFGNKVSQVTLDNGTTCWSISYSQYIQAAVKKCRRSLRQERGETPCSS